MVSNLPKLTASNAKGLYSDLIKLSADYWVLEGAFSKNSLFVAAKFNINSLGDMEKVAFDLVKRATQAGNEQLVDTITCDEVDQQRFQYLHHFDKTDLTSLRVALKGPTWYSYDPKVKYQVIGNQPNPVCTFLNKHSSFVRQSVELFELILLLQRDD